MQQCHATRHMDVFFFSYMFSSFSSFHTCFLRFLLFIHAFLIFFFSYMFSSFSSFHVCFHSHVTRTHVVADRSLLHPEYRLLGTKNARQTSSTAAMPPTAALDLELDELSHDLMRFSSSLLTLSFFLSFFSFFSSIQPRTSPSKLER